MRRLIKSRLDLILISTVCNCMSEFTRCPKLPDFTLLGCIWNMPLHDVTLPHGKKTSNTFEKSEIFFIKTCQTLVLIHCLLLLLLCRGLIYVRSMFSYSVLYVLLEMQSSWSKRESLVLYYYCLPYVLWLVVFCGSFSRCHRLVYSVLLWYFLTILTCFFINVYHMTSRLGVK